MSLPFGFDRLVLGAILLAATISDLRSHEVPLWLSGAGLASGLLVAALHGSGNLSSSLLGLAAGVLPTLPYLLLGGLGGADVLLLATIGVWEGWRFVLTTEWWTTIIGAILAVIARRRRQTTMPYVPAILIGLILTNSVR